MTWSEGAQIPGFEGGGAPSRADGEDQRASAASDTSTACPDPCPSPVDVKGPSSVRSSRRGSPKLDMRIDEHTLEAVRARAKRLGLRPSTWVKSIVRDALDQRRTDEVDAAVGVALVALDAQVQASAEARLLAAQIRPLAINVNDLDARARLGQPVTLVPDTPQLIELLREVRALLGDRVAS